MNELIVSKNEVTMSSLEIAKLTSKEHGHVLRDIRKMLGELYPELDSYESKGIFITKNQVGQSGSINLPKREALILTSGYSVHQRALIIDRWQELETKTPAIADPQIAAMMLMLSNLDAVKTQQEAQKLAIEHHSARLDGIEAKNSAILDGHGFYSILGYSKLKGVKLDVKQSAAMGKKATSESRKHGIMMGTVPDARHGTVKTYHSDVLEIVFEGM